MWFNLYVPKQSTGQSLVFFDVFLASTSPYDMRLFAVQPIVSGAVAVSGVVGVDLHLTRTTAVGTGGTAATVEDSDITKMCFNAIAHRGASLPDGLTGRLTPSGGATAGAQLAWNCVFTEETNASTYIAPTINLARPFVDSPPVKIWPGGGFRVLSGSENTTVGNIGFNCIFKLEPRP